MIKQIQKDRVFWIFLLLLALVFLVFERGRMGDLFIYLEATADFFRFNNAYQGLYGNPPVFHYYSSPTHAFLLGPLTLVSRVMAAQIWKLVGLVLLVRTWKLLQHYFDWEPLSRKQYELFTLLTFVCISFPLYANFHLVQFTLFFLYCILEGLHQIRTKKFPIYGVFILALGILFKLTPLVILPYLLYRGHWKSLLGTLLALALLVLLPATYFGWEHNLFLYREWLSFIDPLKATNTFDLDTRTVHGIAALVSTLTIDGIGNPFTLDLRRHLFDFEPQVVSVLVMIVRLALVGLTLFFLRSQRIFSDHQKPSFQLWELSYLLLAASLIFPHQRTYAFLVLLPTIGYLIYAFIRNPANRKFGPLTIFSLGIILLNLELWLGHYRIYYWHYKTLTYGVLLILGLLLWMHPRKLS